MGRLATDIQTTDGVQVSCKDADLAAATNFKRIQEPDQSRNDDDELMKYSVGF